MARQMTNTELQNVLKTMFKIEGMQRVILSALAVVKQDNISFKERCLLFRIERMVKKLDKN
ncbi:hypothetical protein [Staphylococcus caprae]|uniref:hypothetical protein n=1 Tax=Staphylococcus caprae TaxID=29380 RepID=UPI000E6A2CED|nr:hypothetical protein [Staphylococcus caprae]MBU5271744.1 hypothetical protein [Staphylococcus caprae]MCI2954344.1 hypothetical protein [Staphylococcus caprae]QDW93598.1 hypothetical protein DWB96_04890 [Staphylococcus caprae]RIM33108.1 hypothetical protein BU631_11400 [Staphylococcus caprae]